MFRRSENCLNMHFYRLEKKNGLALRFSKVLLRYVVDHGLVYDRI